jgi:hypothetical protein
MFESQAIETAIGLVLMFFVIALAASSLVEIISQVFKLRAKDLETAIGQMLTGDSKDPDHDPKAAIEAAFGAFKGTSVYEAAAAGAKRGVKRGRPSYLAARSFADGVGEMLGNVSVDGEMSAEAWEHLPEGLRRRLVALGDAAEAVAEDEKRRALTIRSGLEQWFDDTMDRASGAYKRWTKWWLFGLGLVIAIAANASAFHVADRLWSDPPTRSAVVNAAGQVARNQTTTSDDIKNVAQATSKLQQLKLPIGWDRVSRDAWNDLDDYWSWRPYTMLLGWIITGLLVTLGAPFWFNVLTQLASLRSTGAKPPPATDDDASATSLRKDVLSAGASPIFAVQPPEPAAEAEVAAVPPAAVPAARGGPPPPAAPAAAVPARPTSKQRAVAAFGLRAR